MTLFDDSRSTWGAARNTNPRPVATASRIGISWHYDGGSPLALAGKPHSACLSRVKDDQTFHMSPARGWADIGYNALICQHGRVIEGRGFDLQGAHSPGVNVQHYGVQFMVGGSESPTAAALARAVQLRAALEAHSGKTLRQWGHKDDPAASTDCPGSLIESWVHSGGPYKGAAPVTTGGLSMSDVSTILAEIAKLSAAVTATPEATAKAVLWAPTLPGQKGLGGSSVRQNIGSGADAAVQALGIVKSLAAKAGVDVDEKALATALAASLAPTVRQAVLDAGQPSAVADAVVAKLGAALTPPAV